MLWPVPATFNKTSVWVLPTPNAGPNMLIQRFCAKKLKKEEKAKQLVQNLAKNCKIEKCRSEE